MLPGPVVAKLQEDGTIVPTSAVGLSDDFLNSFVHMGDAERRELIMDMEDEELHQHVEAAKAHSLFGEHKHYVITELMAGDMESDDEWTFGDPQGDVLEDLCGWYDYLQARNAKTMTMTKATKNSVANSDINILEQRCCSLKMPISHTLPWYSCVQTF